jgi:ADP-ribose pyrophosphatase
MKTSSFYFASLLFAGCAFAEPIETPSSLKTYLETMKNYSTSLGPHGSWKIGEIEIITDPALIQKIEKQTRLRLEAQGYNAEQAAHYSNVGIVAEDNYWLWMRDAVIFPSGVYGTYDRIIWRCSLTGTGRVGILAMLKNKKIIVNLSYRHATRSWEIELPRGQKHATESIEEAAKRELREETGCTIENLVYLGEMTPDASTTATVLPIYLATASQMGTREKEFSEAIPENPSLTYEQLKEGVIKGYVMYPIQGKVQKVQCRDAMLVYALFLGEKKGFLH